MKKMTIGEKILKFSFPGSNSLQLIAEDTYIRALINGARAGLFAVFVIVFFVIIILL